MNAHQRRKSMRAHGKKTGLDRIPDRLFLLLTSSEPDHRRQGEELLLASGIEPPGPRWNDDDPLAWLSWWTETMAVAPFLGNPDGGDVITRTDRDYLRWRYRRMGEPCPLRPEKQGVVVSEVWWSGSILRTMNVDPGAGPDRAAAVLLVDEP